MAGPFKRKIISVLGEHGKIINLKSFLEELVEAILFSIFFSVEVSTIIVQSSQFSHLYFFL
jgi:hypothetical protein